MLTRIISGGQTGVDIAALRAAKACNLQTGGFMPKGWKTCEGPRPQYERMYGLSEVPSREYIARTRANINASQSTLLLGPDPTSAGMRATIREAKAAGQNACESWLPVMPCGLVGFPQEVLSAKRRIDGIVEWILAMEEFGLVTLNVAGNRDSHLERPVEAWLTEIFRSVQWHHEKAGTK